MKTLNEWLIDNQEEGDDGTGHCDYQTVMCGDCLRDDCHHLAEIKREKDK